MKLIKTMFVILTVIVCLAVNVSAEAERLEIKASKVNAAPVIDGVITAQEWGAPVFEGSPKDSGLFFIPESVKEELIPTNIKLYVTWDAECLYIAAEVTETLHWNGNVGADCWMGDGVQIDICVSNVNQKSKWRTNTAYSTVDGNTYAFVNSVPDMAQEGVEFAGDPPKTDAPFYYGCAKATKNGDTVVYETSYPWVFYGNRAEIKGGHSVLMNIAFYVADGTKSEGEDGSTYLGYVAYGNTVDGKLNYPMLVLSDDVQSTPTQGNEVQNDGQGGIVTAVIIAVAVVIVAAAVVIVLKMRKKQK